MPGGHSTLNTFVLGEGVSKSKYTPYFGHHSCIDGWFCDRLGTGFVGGARNSESGRTYDHTEGRRGSTLKGFRILVIRSTRYQEFRGWNFVQSIQASCSRLLGSAREILACRSRFCRSRFCMHRAARAPEYFTGQQNPKTKIWAKAPPYYLEDENIFKKIGLGGWA
jgi:hypothetical protein